MAPKAAVAMSWEREWPSPPDELTVINGIGRIANQDRTNHLHCRKQQILAFVASRTPCADLLLYGALGATFDIYRHCYLRREYRWSFPTPYVVDDDLRLLGFEVGHAGKAELPDFDAGIARLLSRDQPLLFYAPRGDFAYWVEFMRLAGTVPEEFRELHSFMVCGASAKEILIVDNAMDNHAFRQIVVPRQVLADGYAAEPDRWFTGCMTLAQTGPPDLPGLLARYRAGVEGPRDRFEIYDLIAESFPGERDAFCDTYQAPSVNSLALLAGSRDFFCRFLRHTSHDARVRGCYQQNAKFLAMLQERASRYHAGQADVSADGLRRDLHLMRMREEQAMRLLTEDLRRSPVTFREPAADPSGTIAGRGPRRPTNR